MTEEDHRNITAEDKKSILVQQIIAHYSALVQAWAETRMEKDRSVLGLSAAAIGLLVTLLTAVGVAALWQLVLYIFSALAFGLSIFMALRIFSKNADHLKKIIKTGETGDDPTLKRLDILMMLGFLFGVLILAVIGVSTAWIQMSNRGG